jgi:hypothetical protein
MLESLIAVAPASRAGVLQEQLDLLRAAVEKGFDDPRDRVLAGVADSQGLGGVLSLSDRTPDSETRSPVAFEL